MTAYLDGRMVGQVFEHNGRWAAAWPGRHASVTLTRLYDDPETAAAAVTQAVAAGRIKSWLG